jgi:hypothetical protein
MRIRTSLRLMITLVLFFVRSVAQTAIGAVYLDPSKPVDVRVTT